MYSSWDVRIIYVVVRSVHSGHVKYEIPNLTVKLALVDVPTSPVSRGAKRHRYTRDSPLSTVTAGDIHISVNQSNTGEIFSPFDGWAVVHVAYELSVIV